MVWSSPRRNKKEMAKNAHGAETPPSESRVQGGGKRSGNDKHDEEGFRVHRATKRQEKEESKTTTKRMKMSAATAAAYNHSDEDEESEDNNLDGIDSPNTTKAIWKMDRRELIDVVEMQNRMIKDLKLKLVNKQETGRRSLKLVRMDHDWDAAETLFADIVSEYVKVYLFPWYKFLKPGWDEYQPDTEDSLSSLVERCLSDRQPKSDKKEMWERVTAVTIRLKYSTMKCNLNNVIKAAYKSELSVVAIKLCDNKNG